MAEITNFPKQGDDKEISLRNTNFPQFDYAFAQNIKNNYPDIWAKGGNIRGNEAFDYWEKARAGEETDGVLDWIKEREAWMARHEKDKLIAGVVAVMKWGGIVTRGEKYMKDLINEEKKDDKSMEKVKKVFNFEVKQIGMEEDRMLCFTGSTESEDRDGDIIEAFGWDLTDYKNNPVIMGFHEYDKFPYAKSVNTYIDYQSKKLKFDVQFPTISELTSFPGNSEMIAEHAKNIDLAYNMYKNGYMSAVSVGFIGLEAEPIQDEKGNYKGRRYKKQSLLELSLVPVPSNPTALMEARSKGFISDKELKQLEDKKIFDFDKSSNILKIFDDEGKEKAFTLEFLKSIDNIEIEEYAQWKAGAAISAKNREMMMQAMEHMQMAMDMMSEMMAGKPGEPMEPMEDGCKPKPKSEEIEEIKQALEEIKSQVLLLCQKSDPKDASKIEIDLDAIEFPKYEKDSAQNELDIEPEELKELIKEILNNQIKGGN